MILTEKGRFFNNLKYFNNEVLYDYNFSYYTLDEKIFSKKVLSLLDKILFNNTFYMYEIRAYDEMPSFIMMPLFNRKYIEDNFDKKFDNNVEDKDIFIFGTNFHTSAQYYDRFTFIIDMFEDLHPLCLNRSEEKYMLNIIYNEESEKFLTKLDFHINKLRKIIKEDLQKGGYIL